MSNILARTLRYAFRQAKEVLKHSRVLRRLLYDLDNNDEFSNLFEHEQMIADRIRVDSYQRAISEQIGPDDVVLDLGTGTGILSMFAARKRPRRIYAIDHSDFIGIAQQIAAHNNIDNISFIRANSRDFDPGEKVDVILHEQIGDDLFNENMVENILDLKRRVLREGGRIIPHLFELYVEPFCFKREYRVPHLWEVATHGLDFSCLENLDSINRYKAANYQRRYVPASAFDRMLGQPAPLIAVDLEKLRGLADLPTSYRVSRVATDAGSVDGFCVYFKVLFGEHNQFDTSPFSTHTHWGNRVFRCESRSVALGETIEYQVDMGDLTRSETWSMSLATPSPVPEQTPRMPALQA